jgi:hypothetical protein
MHTFSVSIAIKRPLLSLIAKGASEWTLIGIICMHPFSVTIEIRLPLESLIAKGAFEWTLIGMRHHVILHIFLTYEALVATRILACVECGKCLRALFVDNLLQSRISMHIFGVHVQFSLPPEPLRAPRTSKRTNIVIRLHMSRQKAIHAETLRTARNGADMRPVAIVVISEIRIMDELHVRAQLTRCLEELGANSACVRSMVGMSDSHMDLQIPSAILALEQLTADEACALVLVGMPLEVVKPFEVCIAVLTLMQSMPLPFRDGVYGSHVQLQGLNPFETCVAFGTEVWSVIGVYFLMPVQLAVGAEAHVARGAAEW